MVLNNYTNELSFYEGDYGVPVAYSAIGFENDDQIVFVVSNETISPKVFDVVLDDENKFYFDLALTKEDAEAITTAESGSAVRTASNSLFYSFKHYRNGILLDTLVNGRITSKETVLWQN